VTGNIFNQFHNSAAPISYDIIVASANIEAQLPDPTPTTVTRDTRLTSVILHYEVEGVALTGAPTSGLTSYVPGGAGTPTTSAVVSVTSGGGTAAGHYNLVCTPTPLSSLDNGTNILVYQARFILPANTGSTIRVWGATLAYTKAEAY